MQNHALSPRAGRLLPWLFLCTAACQGVSVDATHDAGVDFARLKTFRWMTVPPQASTAVYDQSMLQLVRAELEGRGLALTESSPDVLVAIHQSVEGVVHTKGWGYELSGGRIRHHEMQKGTLVVDLVDPQSMRCIWRSTAEGAFEFDMEPAEKQQRLTGLLHDMFEGYPPR